MSDFTVTKTRIFAGIWEGVVKRTSGEAEPRIAVTHLGEKVRSVTCKADPSAKGTWQLRIAIPPDRLTDGVQVFLIRDEAGDETLSSFTVITGEPLDDDIRAEVDLIRAELDMLKRAFRRKFRDE